MKQEKEVRKDSYSHGNQICSRNILWIVLMRLQNPRHDIRRTITSRILGILQRLLSFGNLVERIVEHISVATRRGKQRVEVGVKPWKHSNEGTVKTTLINSSKNAVFVFALVEEAEAIGERDLTNDIECVA